MAEERELFGGALRVELPARFEDVSGVRDVPDTQEVFVDARTDESAIVELLEHDASVPDAAFPAHVFADIAMLNAARDSALEESALLPLPPPQLRAHARCAAIARGRQRVAKFREDGAENTVAVWIACVRFPGAPANADVVVSLNSPLQIDPRSSSAQTASALPSQDEARAVVHRALETLRVLDWSIFCC